MSRTHFARAARVRSASFDPDANTIEVVWTTGAAVLRVDPWDGSEYYEVLSLAPGAVRLGRLNAGAPFLDSHDSAELSKIIGSVVPGSAKVDGKRGTCTIQLSRAASDRDRVEKIRDGIIRNVSVGFWIHAQTVSDGSKGIETRTATDWEPLEISAVPIPADADAQIRSAGHSAGPAPRPVSDHERGRRAALAALGRGSGAAPAATAGQRRLQRDAEKGAAEARRLLGKAR